MKIATFCLVALFGGTLAQQNWTLFGGTLAKQNWTEFGYDAWLYGLGPLWLQKKHYDQTHTMNESTYAPENKLHVANSTHSPLFVTPNPNVVYASAHLNLTHNSVRLFVTPNPKNQFYTYEIMDAFTNARPDWYISSTNTPNANMPKEGNFAFVYDKCKGGTNCTIPDGKNITIIKSDMPFLWIVARYYVTNDTQENVDEARRALLNSTLGVANGYDVSKGNAPYYQRSGPMEAGMNISGDPIGALDNLNKWITYNGYGPIDRGNKTEFKNFGLKPNSDVIFADKSNSTKQAILEGVNIAKGLIFEQTVTTCACNEWRWVASRNMGNYGEDFLLRSLVAHVGLGANIPSIGLYFATYNAKVTSKHNFLRGPGITSRIMSNQTYSITLPNRWVEHPPFNSPGFWSVSAYNLSTGTLLNTTVTKNVHYPNKNTVQNSKGEVVIQLSSEEPPPGQLVNWLPLPEPNQGDGAVYLIFRIYAASKSNLSEICSNSLCTFPPVMEVK